MKLVLIGHKGTICQHTLQSIWQISDNPKMKNLVSKPALVLEP